MSEYLFRQLLDLALALHWEPSAVVVKYVLDLQTYGGSCALFVTLVIDAQLLRL